MIDKLRYLGIDNNIISYILLGNRRFKLFGSVSFWTRNTNIMHEHELASSNFLLISLSWCVLCCVSFSVVYRKLQMSCLTYFISMHEYRLISWTNFLNRWTATQVVQLQIKQTFGNWKIYCRVKKVKMEPITLITKL